MAHRDAAERQKIVAPIAGEVVGLRVFNNGSVIGPRETLMEIVPDEKRLIVAHELWEHGGDGLRREQAVLFNAATTITVVLGVLVLYAALFAVALAGGWLVLAHGPLAKTLGHPPNPSDYLRLAWLVSSLSMVGGALGGGLETDETVRQAAYGYHPDPDADEALRYAPADDAG